MHGTSKTKPKSLLTDDALAIAVGNHPRSTVTDLEEIRPTTFETSYFTVDEAISHIGTGKFQWRLLFLTGAIWSADAMEMMLLSFVMPILQAEWSLKPPLDGLISAVVFGGMLCGTAFWSILSDHIGRKKIVMISNLSCAIFGAASGLVPNIWFLLIARFGVGFSVGGSATAYTLFAEYAPAEVRGSLLIIEQSFWSFGSIFSVCLAWISIIYLNWRYYMVFCSIPLFAISLFSKWMPESSRWLLACDKVDEAEQVLKYVAKVNNKPLPQGKLKSVQTSSRGNPLDAFKPQYRSTTISLYIGMFMCVFAYYGICFISVKFFEEVQVKKHNENILAWKSSQTYWESLISASSELPALFVGVYLLDRIGRKKTMLISFGAVSICSFLLLIPFIQNSVVLGVTLVFFARGTMQLGFMTLFIYFSEYYPTAIRSTSLGMASACGRVAGMLTSFVSQDTSVSVGMLLYAIAGIIAFTCTLALKRDTLGKEMATAVAEESNYTLKKDIHHLTSSIHQPYEKGMEMQQIRVGHQDYDKMTSQTLHDDVR
eukprot:734999_1